MTTTQGVSGMLIHDPGEEGGGHLWGPWKILLFIIIIMLITKYIIYNNEARYYPPCCIKSTYK